MSSHPPGDVATRRKEPRWRTTSGIGTPTVPSRSFAGLRSPTTREVGARGQRTQQRILDAALQAFGEDGYHGCSIERITKLARCSRVSFYQYFASKEDVFRHLAEQVARQVTASTEMLDPLTPELEGWTAMRAWVARYAEIYTRYEPVFHALESDDVLAAMARAHRRGDHRADPLAVGDDDVAAASARPGDQAAPGMLEPHARRHGHSAQRRAGRVSERARRDRYHRCPAPHVVRPARRRERAPAERFATACPRVQPRDARVAPAGRGDPRTECVGEPRARRAPGIGARCLHHPRLPQHPRRRSRRGRRRLPRSLLPVLPQQGRARAHPHGARDAHAGHDT